MSVRPRAENGICTARLLQPLGAGAVGGSPEALIGRLYAGQGRQNRLTETSPPRNTPFGTGTRDDQDDGGDIALSSAAGVSGLLRSRATNSRDSFAPQQQDLLVPRLLNASGSQGSTAQRGDGINSPPRIGLRRRSSGNSKSVSPLATAGPAGGPTAPKGNPAGGALRGKQAAADQSAIGGGMSLSRSLGALGQAGAGRSTVAIVNTRDDGAPYLRSEKMSPKSHLR